MSAPYSPPPRYASLDVLRGVAILGTLATNIWIFTDPEGLVGYLQQRHGRHDSHRSGRAIEAVLQQLAQGKFLGLLTLMFGIGLEIQRRSAVRAGRRWPGRYPWRAGLLLLDGLLHFVLVAEFDVLMGYAVTGMVVAYLLATSEQAQRAWLVVASVVHVLLLSLVTIALLSLPSGSGRSHRSTPTRTPTAASATWSPSGWTTWCCSGWSRSSSPSCRSPCSWPAPGCCGPGCSSRAGTGCGCG